MNRPLFPLGGTDSRLRPLTASILALALSLACGPKGSSNHATYFPESNEVNGWSVSGETRTFPADQLWKYLDGDADKYLQAGVRQTLTADYRYNDKIEATADLFVMSDAAGAAKVFESHSTAGSRPIRLGDAARLYRGSLTLRKGRYFVRLVAFEDFPEVPDALVALGSAIARKLK